MMWISYFSNFFENDLIWQIDFNTFWNILGIGIEYGVNLKYCPMLNILGIGIEYGVNLKYCPMLKSAAFAEISHFLNPILNKWTKRTTDPELILPGNLI